MMEEMMNPRQWLKQMVDFQKTAFDSSFNMMSMFQSRTEKMTDLITDQMCWGSERVKNAFTDWLKMCQDGSERVKKAVDDNMTRMESYMNNVS